jgi:HlyD family secretion protein
MSRVALLLLALASLAGCGEVETGDAPVERVAAAPLELVVEADGQLKAVKATPLLVPGQNWAQRQVEWMKADGSRVEAGELVAKFSAAQGQLELDKALLDLQRNALARGAKQDELGALQGRVDVDLAQVGTELAIAQRYAGAELEMFARNLILDAVQDERFLGEKQGVLEWKRGQAGTRGAAELAVLDSQRATYDLAAGRKRDDLAALELRAPNAGVLVLTADWSGEKPKVGAVLWAGNEFASLPDAAALEVELLLPQLEAQGLAAGAEVELHPAGRPEQAVRSTLSWVASAAAVKNRQSPVKYLRMKAAVPAEAAQRHAWVPGQAFRARLYVQRKDQALSVPNVAIVNDAGRSFVEVQDGAGFARREITLGARGPGRSEVLDGLAAGEVVLLTPTRRSEEGGAPAPVPAAAPAAAAQGASR